MCKMKQKVVVPTSQITEEIQQKDAHTVLDTVCSEMLLAIALWGAIVYYNTLTRFFGLLGSSLICLSIKKCLKLNKFFFLIQFSVIGSTALQITLNYPSCFLRL